MFFLRPPVSLFLPSSFLCSVSHLFRFAMLIKHPSRRHFDSQGEIEAWGPWETCALFCIISIYRRTNVLALQEHDWPVKQQHVSSSSLYCCCRTPEKSTHSPFRLILLCSSCKISIPIYDPSAVLLHIPLAVVVCCVKCRCVFVKS